VEDVRALRRILVLCAAVILLLAPTDWLTLGQVTGSTLFVRGIWAAVLLLGAFALPRVEPARVSTLTVAMALSSTAFYAALAQLTGGPGSALFQWIVAFPLVVALVLQDQPEAIVGSGIALVACGLGILLVAGEEPAFCAQWAIQAVVMTWLALYASTTYRSQRARETALRKARDDAAARVSASEAAVGARDQFLAVAAHELRTPLTSLLLHIEAMERGVLPTATDRASVRLPPERRWADAIARQARRLSSLIDGMLDVSRMTGGRLSLQLERVDVAVVAREVVGRFAADAAAASCPMTIHLDRPLVGLYDPNRLDQIVTNLIGNALKYGAGAPIEIDGYGDEEIIRLIVRDHGIGISPADQERIFRRFERATSDQEYSGLGLGLWISGELAKALGGRISVHSSPGAGATFTLELPRAGIIEGEHLRRAIAR
jgi:signal transduction histidine kinase